LRVSVLPSFLHGWLLPRIQRFCRKHPRIRLHWHAAMDYACLEQGHVDCAIRFGHGRWGESITRPLMRDQLILVASPDFLSTHTVNTFERLLKCPLLHASESWSAYLSGLPQAPALRVPSPRMVFNDSTHLLDAAAQGMGVALTRRSIADKALNEGAITLAWPHVCEHASAYYALWPQHAGDNPMRETFLNRLQLECSRNSAGSVVVNRR
jgi:LysR family glycine cleavage system transcriptional activator